MVADEKVDLTRELALQRADQIKKLMRFVAAGGVSERPVHDLLKHQVSSRLLGEVGDLQQPAKVLHVAVHVAADEQFIDILQVNQPAPTAWCGAKGEQGFSDGLEACFRARRHSVD